MERAASRVGVSSEISTNCLATLGQSLNLLGLRFFISVYGDKNRLSTMWQWCEDLGVMCGRVWMVAGTLASSAAHWGCRHSLLSPGLTFSPNAVLSFLPDPHINAEKIMVLSHEGASP